MPNDSQGVTKVPNDSLRAERPPHFVVYMQQHVLVPLNVCKRDASDANNEVKTAPRRALANGSFD